MSRTGVLLFADGADLEPGGLVEMVLQLLDEHAGAVTCTGRIVRRALSQGRALVAASIDDFSFSAPGAEAHGA